MASKVEQKKSFVGLITGKLFKFYTSKATIKVSFRWQVRHICLSSSWEPTEKTEVQGGKLEAEEEGRWQKRVFLEDREQVRAGGKMNQDERAAEMDASPV